ncbi:MAG TPA: thioredoxin domain-containing protein [Nannocystaceae bacterium]|nr:thioredoxin domain-containing protein [Nannocystaceae bacterium]
MSAPDPADGRDGPGATRATTPRRLATSTSPYLRQHADNPVDWVPWGDDALARARAQDKPILLSVGYSACHWCHVMAHESFEDPDVAAVMNERFVNIKVDREERPDIDAIYQKVVQLMGQGGGWPLTVFLTPQQEPFYAGTYFPKDPRYGRPGFVQVMDAITDLWTNRRDKVVEQTTAFREGLRHIAGIVDDERARAADEPSLLSPEALRLAVKRLVARIDGTWGGFGREPKFPNPTALELLLRVAKGDASAPTVHETQGALRLTLAKMYEGGIYDHLRGGFARYSVDRVWLVPHFEKMLYDNALLLPIYAEAALVWPEAAHLRKVVRETVDYLVADMRDGDTGLFYSATDADSEGEEGKYFAWTPAELAEVLDEDDARVLATVYGVSERGNFEHGRSILHLAHTIEERATDLGVPASELHARLDRARARLLARRAERVPPLRDDKLLTSWNALLASGLVRAAAAARAWGEPERAEAWGALAIEIVRASIDRHVDGAGRVMRAGFAGVVHTRGVLDDVAFLGRACLDVHEHSLDRRWLDEARALAAHALQHYARAQRDGFFFTADDGEALIERSESQHDGPLPSGVGVMVELLARLDLAGHAPEGARDVVEAVVARFRGAPAQPFGYASLIGAACFAAPDAVHVTVRGPTAQAEEVRALATAARTARLRRVPAISLSFEPAPEITAIVCRAQVCSAPVTTIAELEALL